MKKMQELSELLCKELDKYAEKRSMTAGDLDIGHKLSDSIKNLYKIEMLEDGDYEDDDSMYSGYGRGMSMARGRGENYSNARYQMNDGYSTAEVIAVMTDTVIAEVIPVTMKTMT